MKKKHVSMEEFEASLLAFVLELKKEIEKDKRPQHWKNYGIKTGSRTSSRKQTPQTGWSMIPLSVPCGPRV